MSHLSRAVALAAVVVLLALACTPPPPRSSTPAAAQPSHSDNERREATPTVKPPPTPEPRERNTPTPVAQIPDDIKITPVLDGVILPLALQFAPDGRMFFNEASKGAVRIMHPDGTLQEEPFVQLRVARRTEMGALGLALHPDFATNHWVYVFYSQAKNDNGDPEDNRVVRFTERDGQATERTVIVKDLPAGICCHNGGRIGFGPDRKLYITIGDINQEERAQNPKRLHGKILRLEDDGSIPADNPDPTSPIFASGFRNPYGLAFHPITGVPYISENGEVGHDEINRIVPGGNYGNPVAEGYARKPGFIDPIWESETGRVAPSGATFYTGTLMPEYQGDFFFCAYNTGDLTRMRFGGPNYDQIVIQEVLAKVCYLDVATAPDGSLYLSHFTSILRFGR